MMRCCFFGIALGARDHALGGLLGDEEGAAQVGVHDVAVVVFGDVDQALGGGDAGVVDQDVDRARFGFRVGDGRS